MAAGHLFDAVRRGLAEPVVLFERFGDLDRRGAAYAAVCFSGRHPGAEKQLAGRHRIGYVRDRTIVLGTAEAIAAFPAVAPPGLPLGIAEPAGQGEIRRVLAEAVAAHEVALRRGGPATSRDLATVDGLMYRLTADQVAPFQEHVLRPLTEARPAARGRLSRDRTRLRRARRLRRPVRGGALPAPEHGAQAARPHRRADRAAGG